MECMVFHSVSARDIDDSDLEAYDLLYDKGDPSSIRELLLRGVELDVLAACLIFLAHYGIYWMLNTF